MVLSKKQLIACFLFIFILLLFWRSGITNYFTLEMIQNYKQYLHTFVSKYYMLSAFIFILLYMICVSLSVPAAALSMLGGFLFGFLPGLFIVLIGATLGASLIFFVVRYLFGKSLQKKYAQQLASFNEDIKKNGIYYLLSLRLSIIVPFFIVNILSGLTTIPYPTFALTTYFGIIPSTSLYVYAGKQLQEIKNIRDVFTPSILIVFLVLALLSLLPVWLNKRKT